MLEWIGRPAKNVPQQPTPPLRVSISKKLRAYVEDKYSRAGVEKGKYVVIHGIASDSVANMKSRGDDDCLLPLEHWAQIAKEIRWTIMIIYLFRRGMHNALRWTVIELHRSSIWQLRRPGAQASVRDPP